MASITTTELVNKIFDFCQVYSGVEFFPYQAQFGKRIIRSILENDGEEITALFSRQCIEENQLVHMADGTKKPIKDVQIGDKVLCFDYNKVVEREVIDAYHVGKREVYKLELISGDSILCTLNHRFLCRSTRLFREVSRLEHDDEIAYINSKGKRRFSGIKSIQFMGDLDTYDIEVESAENFFCNNMLVHNSGKSETVATISGGLAIILPTLANLPMFVTDKRLDGFKSGLMIGIFAPTLRQAQISFSRMKKRMGSAHSQAVMSDPEINVSFDVSNGQNIMLSNGSLICCQSASDGSNIEGDSYMLIIVDEAQDVGNFKYSKSISPMGAFYNATKILIGTATTQRGFFLESIERNKKVYEQGGKRNHFEYNYETVIKYNPKYGKYIEGEKKRLGEHSDEFQMSYCVSPETKILTSDFRWIRADSIKTGDRLIGFDENPPKRYGQRKYREAIVEDTGVIERPCYKISLSDGTEVVCSEEHQWLVFTAGSRTQWKMTKDLVSTDRIYKICDVWDDLPQDYRLGYLSGAFDGEGCITQVGGLIRQITFAQRDNIMLERVKQYLDDFGFDYNAEYYDKRKLKLGKDAVYKLFIKGGKRELFRFLGSVRPKRLLGQLDINQLGTVRCSNNGLGSEVHPKVEKLEYVGTKKVIPIRTSTRTYVAEGLASHNCLKWILERGMFIDPKIFDKLACPEIGLTIMDTQKVHVAGIDLGKKNDSTVVTILEVDWDNPIIVEQSKELEIPDYIAYNVCVKNWLEIQGDNWNEQYDMILDFLSNYNIARVVMDATGVGDAIYDRLRANVDYEVVPYVLSKQSKSELYKNLNTEIRAGRVRYPADPETQDTREFRSFQQQFYDLEKTYSGQLMVVSHPDVAGAHDDYCDSLALAVWGAKGDPVSKPVTENISIYDNLDKKAVLLRNSFTARRRR